jgi:metallo-beta-lactamase family protein
VVVESTYGDRLHEGSDPQAQLGEVLRRVAGRGGSVLIPAFAVGRAQTLLYHLLRLYESGSAPRLPVFLDSPMAIDATGIFESFRAEHRLTTADTRAVCSLARFTRTSDESKAIAANKVPCVVLSASGMATGGRVLHHLKTMAPDRRNAIVLAGFQAPGTRGQALQDGAKAIKIHGDYVEVQAEVVALRGVSSHADANGLLAWLRSNPQAPRCCFVTHGEPAAADALRLRIQEELGWDCRVPAYGDSSEARARPSG